MGDKNTNSTKIGLTGKIKKVKADNGRLKRKIELLRQSKSYKEKETITCR